MSSFITYLIELNIAITVFFLVYKVVFRRDANFSLRRGFLLYAMMISLIVPLLDFSLPENTSAAGIPLFTLEEVIAGAEKESVVANTITNLKSLFHVIFLGISAYFLLKMIISIIMILRNASKSEIITINNHIIHNNRRLHATSFFNYIFVNVNNTDRKDLMHIIEHELQHARLGHSFDRLLTEVVLILGWVNPITWILRKEVVINHEYQADNKMIEQGTDHISYQLTILNQYIGSASITNKFSSHIKNRIVMLNKNYKKGSFLKSLLLLPLSILLLFFMACDNDGVINEEIPIEDSEVIAKKGTAQTAEEMVFYVVEEMPQWPGEEDLSQSMRKFIAQNLKYPKIAIENGVEGKVFITFMVTKTGDVMIPDPDILPAPKSENNQANEVVVIAYRPIDANSPTPDEKYINQFKEEGKRVVELMPDLVPGKQRGVPVNVLFTMPITFKLK